MRKASIVSHWLPVHRLRTAVAAFLLVSLAACANWPARDDTPDTGELLRNSLPVAAAALAAGQLNVARRLYISLSERFDSVPEPLLGLGYIAFQSGDSAAAENYFRQAAEKASDAPALQAEALLGAGRAALVQGKTERARRHFRNARAPGKDTPLAGWIANGLAVASTLEGDYEAAATHYDDARRLLPGSPRIAANFIRTLVAAGRIDDAARAYAQHPPSHWPDDDGAALSRLIEDARLQRRIEALARPRVKADAKAPDESQVPGDATPGTGRARCAAARARSRSRDAPVLVRHALRGGRRGRRVLPERPRCRASLCSCSISMTGRIPRHRPRPTPAPHRAPRPARSPRLPRPRSPGHRGRQARASRTPPTPSRRPPEPIAAGADSPAPAPGPVPSRADSVAAGSGPAAPGLSASSPAPRVAAEPRPPHEEAGVPAVESPDHSSSATLTLTVGQSRRLHLERDAATVLVASPEVADVRLLSPGVLYVIGKEVGRTTVAVLDDEQRVEERVVAVVLDLEPLRTILASEPDLRDVHARHLSRGMALTGEVASAASVDRALRLAAGALPEGVTIENELRIAASQQVNLEVQIAEVHRLVTEDLGVNWEAFRVREGAGVRIGRVIDESPFPVALPPSAEFEGRIASSIFLSRESANTRIAAMIDALATAGLANVLARPNLTAVSGESASFFSGGERPIPTGYDANTRTIIFEYKKVGVLLDFVPTVVDTGRIVLTVRPEVSEPDTSQPLVIGPVLLPVINVRRAETTVEVGDGESIVIAGLFSNRSSNTEAGLPGLKDVPLLGLLFGTTSIQSNELELIVIVTARLVQPHATPDDRSAPAATLQANGYHY